jgi:hypothetical protein
MATRLAGGLGGWGGTCWPRAAGVSRQLHAHALAQAARDRHTLALGAAGQWCLAPDLPCPRARATATPHTYTAQHSTAQHSTAQHGTAQHSTAQHSTAQHNHNHTRRTEAHTSRCAGHTLLGRACVSGAWRSQGAQPLPPPPHTHHTPTSVWQSHTQTRTRKHTQDGCHATQATAPCARHIASLEHVEMGPHTRAGHSTHTQAGAAPQLCQARCARAALPPTHARARRPHTHTHTCTHAARHRVWELRWRRRRAACGRARRGHKYSFV